MLFVKRAVIYFTFAVFVNKSKFMSKLIPLSEGAFTVDRSKSFVPFEPDEDELSERPSGSLLVEVQPFLVITEKDHILLDNGLGFETENGDLQIYQKLESAGIAPEKISKVLLSHLHKDHTGGISKKNDKGQRVLSFPEATYYIDKSELDYALTHPGSSYLEEELSILSQNPQVELLAEKGVIEGYIKHERSGGHCPYHQVFWIKTKDETYFYGGDVAPQLFQLQRRFIAKYDYDGKKSRDLRQQYLEQGTQEGWTFLFYHDIKTPYKKFEKPPGL